MLAAIGKGRDYSHVVFKKGTGCPHCHNTGYRGRIGIFEMLELNQTMAEALRVNDLNAFMQAANAVPDFVNLSEAALGYAIEGLTTLDEVMSISAQVSEI